MDIKETINVIDYGIKYYHDKNLNMGFTALEYYSITDIPPEELSKIAYKSKMTSQGLAILNFCDKHYWNLKEINKEEKIRNLHSFNGVELTADDKLSIIDKLKRENYPLIEGIYGRTAFLYANNIEFTKESIRQAVLDDYEHKTSKKQKQSSNNQKVLKKTKY